MKGENEKMKSDLEQTEIEAPYELPEGWKWCRLGDFINIFRGVSYKKNDAHNEKQENDCLIIRGGNIDEGCINLNSDNVFVNKSLVSENQIIKKNDVIIVTSTGSIKVIGRAGVSASDYEDVAFGAFLTLARPNEKANKSFVNQYFQSSLYRERIRQLASGVNINNIRIEYITESPFPLPPTLDEQQRIVNRIESMFAKLDEAKEKAQNVVDGFETRKAAILHKAFTGELTAKWRKENGVSDDSWEEKTIGEAYFINPKVKADDEILASFIPMEKIEPAGINQFTFDIKSWGSIKKNHTQFQNGDVCFAKISPCFENGKAFIARNLENGIGAGTTELIILRSTEIDTHYTFYVVTDLSFVRKCCTTYSGTVGQQRINMDYVRNYKINLPTLPEQVEIVRILDIIIEKENKAKQAAEAVLEQIDLLKKSILARAFRGEL